MPTSRPVAQPSGRVSVGGGDCRDPFHPTVSTGCYRLAIARSNSPLGFHLFDADRIPDGDLPSNPAAYARFIGHPDGRLLVFAFFVPPIWTPAGPGNFLDLAPFNSPQSEAVGTLLAFPLDPKSPMPAIADYVLNG